MKRDEPFMTAAYASAGEESLRVERRPLYLDGASFGWFHSAGDASRRDCVAVICAPVGYEYTRAHRTLRHLADRLARRGIPALRFDYPGIGDSPGTDLDRDRLGAWRAGIKTAIGRARELSGCERVALVGVRLGASLAAQVAAEMQVDSLMLWNPCITGRPYLRELQAIARTAERTATDIDGALESGGFVMSSETLEAIRALNLLELPIKARRVLVAGRDDLTPDESLCERLSAAGVDNEFLRLPGWSGMMAEHQFTVVPERALETIVDWIAAGTGAGAPPPDTHVDARGTLVFPLVREDGWEATIEERLCEFGEDKHLFGILSRAGSDPGAGRGPMSRPAIVFLNAGAVHHVGPNRLYVTLARNLSAMGFDCLRFDLESLGDSVRRTPGRENHPYPESGIADVRAALEFLRERFGHQRFIAIGLCSGAHNAFHAGLQLEHALEQLILVNPLAFYWVEGMTLETTRHFEDMVQYRKSMRDPGRWLKLLRGDVNFRRLLEVAVAQAGTRARTWWDTFAEWLLPDRGPRLSRDLRKLFAKQRRVALFVADGDPGRDILMAGAKRTAARALKSGDLRIEMISNADHTFSQSKPRRELVARLLAHLG